MRVPVRTALLRVALLTCIASLAAFAPVAQAADAISVALDPLPADVEQKPTFTVSGHADTGSYLIVELVTGSCSESGRRSLLAQSLPAGDFSIPATMPSFQEVIGNRIGGLDATPVRGDHRVCATLTSGSAAEAAVEWKSAGACPSGISVLAAWTYPRNDAPIVTIGVPGPGLIVGNLPGGVSGGVEVTRAGIVDFGLAAEFGRPGALRPGRPATLKLTWRGDGKPCTVDGGLWAEGSTETATTLITIPGRAASSGRGSLMTALRPSTDAARIPRLLAAGSFATTFKSSVSGRVRIVWETGTFEHEDAASRVVVASGTAVATRGKRVTVRVRLTPAGKQLLRRAARLDLMATGTFTAQGTSAVAVESFTVHKNMAPPPHYEH